MSRPIKHPHRLLATLVMLSVMAGFWSLVTGCDGRADRGRPKVLLYCGAGIRDAAEALIKEFESESAADIQTTYGGSGHLLGQIATNQIGGLFMPGAEFYVDSAIEQGLADAPTKRVVLYFVPVLFVAEGNPKGVQSLEDLLRPGLRVGLGDERACAVGKRSVQIFEKNDIALEDVQQNVVFKSGTVNELCVAVQLGSVDVAIVWDANARQFAEHGDTVELAPNRNLPSTVPIVRLTSSRHPELAQEFVQFATSDRARALLAEQGYTVELEPKSLAD